MSLKYHVGSKGAVLGEKNAEEIRESLSNNTLSPNDKVWLPGWKEWKTIAETPELHDAPAGSSPTWYSQPNIKTFFQTFRTILLQPSQFAYLPESPRMSQAFVYLTLSVLASSLINSGFITLSGLQIPELDPLVVFGAIFGAMTVGGIVTNLIFALLTHLCVRLAGGKKPMSVTFATLLPCQGAGVLLSVVPVAGLLLSVWPFVSGIIALAGSQHISILKSSIIQVGVVLLSMLALAMIVAIPVLIIAISGANR